LSQNELLTLTNNQYQSAQIAQAEAQMANLLGFRLLSTTPAINIMVISAVRQSTP
jgi:hypothetical protein